MPIFFEIDAKGSTNGLHWSHYVTLLQVLTLWIRIPTGTGPRTATEERRGNARRPTTRASPSRRPSRTIRGTETKPCTTSILTCGLWKVGSRACSRLQSFPGFKQALLLTKSIGHSGLPPTIADNVGAVTLPDEVNCCCANNLADG